MIKITFLCAGRLKEDYEKKAMEDYLTRLSKYAKTEVTEVPESDVQGEGETLVRKIPERSFVIALDLHGKMTDSVAFAKMLESETLRGHSHFTFVIGGSDGISDAVTSKADLRLCLSPMTFTHRMTRIIIAEQIYRAMKINSGETYHK